MTKSEIKSLIRENEKLKREKKELEERVESLECRAEILENANLWLAEQLEYRNRAISHHGYVREIDIL